MMGWVDNYKVSVPEGESRDWKVEKFTVSEDDAKLFNLRQIFNRMGGRRIKPGEYTKLTHNGHVVMSDTPAEIRDHLEPIRLAKGQVLINGLGLGVVVQACLAKEEVEHLTVVEISEDVIKLVGSHYEERFGDRLEIVHADAMMWKSPKGVRYDVVWHDIWGNMCEDNLPEMHTLHRRYGRKCDWQGSWGRDMIEYESRRGRW